MLLLGQHAWHLGIGDPNAPGWTITLGYLATAAFCFFRSRHYGGLHDARFTRFWFMVGLFLLLMGINKQLDLQTLLIGTAKVFSLNYGFYQYRHRLVVGFIVALLIWGAVSQAWLYTSMKRLHTPERRALLGLGILFVFIAARVAYFQHVAVFHDTVLAQRFYWFMEIAAIVCIASAAYSKAHWKRRLSRFGSLFAAKGSAGQGNI